DPEAATGHQPRDAEAGDGTLEEAPGASGTGAEDGQGPAEGGRPAGEAHPGRPLEIAQSRPQRDAADRPRLQTPEDRRRQGRRDKVEPPVPPNMNPMQPGKAEPPAPAQPQPKDKISLDQNPFPPPPGGDPRTKSLEAFAAVWERNIGSLDDMPEVKKALFDLV